MILNTLDLFIIGAIALSSVFGLFRGFFSSVLSLVTWIVALWLPFRFTDEFSTFLPATVESPVARSAIAAGLLFFGSFIILSAIGLLVRKAIGITGLGIIDRIFGIGLGAVRGVIFVALLAMLANYSSAIPKERWWNESNLMPFVLQVSKMIRSQLPDNLARLFVLNRI